MAQKSPSERRATFVRLYTERSGEEEEEGTEKEEKLRVEKKSSTLRKEGPKSVKPKDMGGVDAMALLEQHYGEGIARARPTSLHTVAKPSPEATDNLLVSSRAVEIRRSQPKHQKSQQDFVWRPRSAQHASKTLTAQSKRNMDTSGEEYSCRRQKLELLCEDRRRQTQFVLRWYAKGKPVASDPTIRTREECELLCSDPLDFRNRNVRLGEERRVGGGGGERNAGGDGATPVDLSKPEETFETVPSAAADEKFTESVRGGGEAPFVAVAGAQNVEASAPETNPSASSAEFSEFLATEQRRQPKKRCLKVSPYRSMCPDGMPSQFTLRWHFRDDACFAYPYGYCHGESVMAEEPIKTEQECLKTCAVAEQSQHQMTPEDPIL
uniref:BPTI/Kunitz inhibitor domain-containing protein n=1 Tax=Globodera pallida TaxID=36090 RepID=A0A183BXX8_GLOPA